MAGRELRFQKNISLRYDGPKDVLEEALMQASVANGGCEVVAFIPIDEKGKPIFKPFDEIKTVGIYTPSRNPNRVTLKEIMQKQVEYEIRKAS